MTDEELAWLEQTIHQAFETGEGSASENRADAALFTLIADYKLLRGELEYRRKKEAQLGQIVEAVAGLYDDGELDDSEVRLIAQARALLANET
jgi:hypothetical protein